MERIRAMLGVQRALILLSSVKIKPHALLQKTLVELKSKIV
ncbi:MAG: hypothetical protein ACKO5Z_01650 [Burkholderiaceae bacterium]